MATTVKTQPASLREWQVMFWDMYFEKDRRDYTLTDLLLHLQEEAAKIDEGIRKEKNAEIIEALPHFFCWFLSFCNMANLNLEEIIWEKYPGICPYCGVEKNCMCITAETKPPQWFKNPNGRMPVILTEWQAMLWRIYGRIDKLVWVIQVWLHVHEELGEFSKEFRLDGVRAKKSLEELADAFVWLLSFCSRIDVNLGDITWQVYPGVCSVCKQPKCHCPKV